MQELLIDNTHTSYTMHSALSFSIISINSFIFLIMLHVSQYDIVTERQQTVTTHENLSTALARPLEQMRQESIASLVSSAPTAPIVRQQLIQMLTHTSCQCSLNSSLFNNSKEQLRTLFAFLSQLLIVHAGTDICAENLHCYFFLIFIIIFCLLS